MLIFYHPLSLLTHEVLLGEFPWICGTPSSYLIAFVNILELHLLPIYLWMISSPDLTSLKSGATITI